LFPDPILSDYSQSYYTLPGVVCKRVFYGNFQVLRQDFWYWRTGEKCHMPEEGKIAKKREKSRKNICQKPVKPAEFMV